MAFRYDFDYTYKPERQYVYLTILYMCVQCVPAYVYVLVGLRASVCLHSCVGECVGA